MNKLFTKIAALCLGATMAVGVGVAVANTGKANSASAALNNAAVWSSGTPAFGSSYASGTKTLNNISWFVSCAGNNTSLGWNSSTQGSNNNASSAPLNTISETTKYGTYQSSGGWKVGKIVVSFSNADSVTGTWYIWYSDNNGSSWTKATTGTLTGSTASITYDHGSNIGDSVRFAFGFGTTKTTKTRINISNIQVYKYDEVQNYTVSFVVNTAGYGTLSSSSIANVPSGSGISVSNNTVTINGTTITATPTASTAQYTYAFSSWSNASGTITAARTITANFTRTTNTFTVSDSGISHGSLDSTAAIEYDGDLVVQIVPDSGYSYPSEITVTMGGNDITGDVLYDDGDGTILYEGVTGNIVIEATCPASGNAYSISTSVTNGTYSGDTSITDNGGTASVTIAPTGDYKLPASVSVSGASHTYNQNTGVISLSNASGNVTISAAMVALTPYSITVNETNGSHTGASTIKESRTASLTFTPASGYANPSSVAVSGATSSWTRGTGVLSLSNPTGNVIVTYVAVGNELDSIELSANSGSYTLGDPLDVTVTAKYTINEDADVTDSANLSVSGYDPYTEGSHSVTFSYTEGGITKKASYTATVSAASVSTTTYYQKCTSMSDIVNGGKYVLVGYKESSKQYYAMPSYSSGNNIQGATVTLTENETRLTEANMSTAAVYTLTSTGTANQYYIGDGSQYLYAAGTGTNNHLKGKASTDSTAGAFTISYSTFFSVVAASSNRNTMRFNATNNPPIFSCYANNDSQTEIMFFKEVKEQSGSADLIRITASFSPSETKYVGDSISASDFVVQKQYNTGETLSPVASGFTLSTNTLASTHNVITVSYTEGNITETADVEIDVVARTATVTSVSLVQGQGVVTDYIDWSGAAWDYTGLTVHCVWSDSSFNEDLSLADLVQGGDATVSPAKPAEGVTSFTVSYTYHGTAMTGGTVSGITVVADYVTNISWTGTTAAHFKAFSGGQLTAAQVGAWSVVPTFAGAGQGSALSFGQYTLKVGSKTISSLPYTWASEDDGQELSITYGKDENGDDFVKKNNTAVGNICATINAIDHSETISGDIEKTATLTKDNAIAIHTASGVGNSAGVEVDHDIDTNIHITGAKGSHGSSVPLFWKDGLRVYAGNTLTISPMNGAVITSISLTSSGATCSASAGSSPWTISSGGDEDIVITTPTKTTPISSSVVVEYTITGSETTTVHYANDMDHFDAQKKVVEFAKYMNTTMNGSNVCTGTFANLESAWDDVADKYDELFGASTTLNETELAWAKNMLAYATAAWGSDAEAACVEKAMQTYEYCSNKYGLDEFLDGVRSVGRAPSINPVLANLSGANNTTITIAIVISLVSVTAIGGYFFLRKRKENI